MHHRLVQPVVVGLAPATGTAPSPKDELSFTHWASAAPFTLPPEATAWLRLAGVPVILLSWDEKARCGMVAAANRRAGELLGYRPGQISGLPAEELVQSLLQLNALCSRLRPGAVRQGGLKLRDGRGGHIYCGVRLALAGGLDNLVALSLSPSSNIDGVSMACSVMEGALEGFVLMDRQGCISQVNPAFSAITGYDFSDVVGKTPEVLYAGLPNGPEFFQAMWQQFVSEGSYNGEVWSRKKNGVVYSQWLSLTALNDTNGEHGGFTAVFQEVSEEGDQGRHRVLSQYDALTGLPNRTWFMDRLAVALAGARRGGEAVAVLYLDVDNLKAINDSLGRAVGDTLLMEMASRLRGRLRQQDSVARLGDDEFVLVINEVSDSDAGEAVARRVLEGVSGAYQASGQEVFISASVGISLFPNDARQAEALVRNAETAMYQAKEKGRGGFSLYTQGMNAKISQRLSLENQLRKAILGQEFVVYYQPRVCLRTGRVLGAEALVRWQRPGRDLVMPGSFIPLAEETGLIVPIGQWVMGEACRQMRAWHKEGHKGLCLSVNVSARQLLWQNDLVQQVESALADNDLEAGCLEVEVTESAVMHNLESAIDTMGQIRKLGVLLALDDFGTGYSSLQYLKHFPVDTLKIDRSFVCGLPEQNNDVAIVTGVLSLAHSLGLTVVAEGVETRAQQEFLRARQCHQMQGYLFSRPVPAREFQGLLESKRRMVLEDS